MIRILTLILATILISNIAHAKCDLKYELGDPITKMENDFGGAFPSFIPGVITYPILSEDICPEQKLDNVMIEYKFIDDKLVAYNLFVLNDEQDDHSEKLVLLNYTQKVYGEFETGNPITYRGYKIFEEGNDLIVYQKADGPEGITDEQLYISDKEHDYILMTHMEKMETETEAEYGDVTQWN